MRATKEEKSVFAGLIRQFEKDQGFELVEEAPWLKLSEWNEIVISRQEDRIRLVLLDARFPGKGALSRLIAGIKEAGLHPVIVEPIGLLEGWCEKHGWRRKSIGRGEHRQVIWYERNTVV